MRPFATKENISFSAALVLALILATPAIVAAQQCPQVSWSDEFGGSSLDPAKWSYQIGDGCAEGICGWGNNEEQYYQEQNVTVSNGTLKITARRERVRNKQYTSGRIRTLNKGDFTYGRFEARIKMTHGKGIWPAFWMMPTDEVYGGWPKSGEIDIMENVGHEPATVHGTIHFGQDWPNNSHTGASFTLHENTFADDFYVFAVEKEQGVIRWLVNDILYSVKTPADTDPHNWPFDERFHFILNVAVGGNWPGSPDATTVFPQVLEVDYVRVYNDVLPHITGPRKVVNQASGSTYSVGNVPAGSTISWSVPSGATITSGQGTGSITVDWGNTGGDVVAQVSSGCGTSSLRIDVDVEPAYEFGFTFVNFDDPPNVSLNTSRTTGTLVEVDNPSPSGINSSARSGRYTRNSSQLYDVLFYNVSVINDAGEYKSSHRKFSMDVYTQAPEGTEILLQLENSSRATASNFPTGRHSRYQAVTSVRNQWERLTFAYVDSPDPSTADNSIDNIVLLFKPNTNTGDVYYVDNFDSYVAEGGGGGPGPDPDPPTTMHVSSIVIGSQSASQGNKRGTATITVRDDGGSPVENAMVSGAFSGDFNETGSGTTSSDGSVTLVTTGMKKGSLNFIFCVDEVSHATLAYDPSSNVQTCNAAGKTDFRAESEHPEIFSLSQNYPNPFNPSTRLSFTLPEAAAVSLSVYDALGRQVAILADGHHPAGAYEISFDAYGLPSGVYHYRLQAGAFSESRSMLLAK